MKTFRLIGLMSGTSLDGLDIADVTFKRTNHNEWSYHLNRGITVSYSDQLSSRLAKANKMNGEELSQLSVDLAVYYGDKVNAFISTYEIPKNEIFAVASHGQTVFHQPEKGLTTQIGNLPHLSVETGLRTVVDFRTKDVALGGNGAPLIPIVDHTLYKGQAQGFLNLGGFSNLSYLENGNVKSFDVGPANIVINHLVQGVGEKMDHNGDLARSGVLINELLNALEDIEYYKQDGPKSLGWEWVEDNILNLLKDNQKLEDQLHTYCVHIVKQLIKSFNDKNLRSVMVTGGGVFNKFIMGLLIDGFDGEIIVPDDDTVNYKEAIGFAWLGLMRCLGEINVLSSVTGAKKDSSSGIIYTA